MISLSFTNVADALISYTIDKLDPAERIKSWLKQGPARIAFQKALARAYSAFARQYPEYTSSLFGQSFLRTDALPELSKLLTRNQHPDPVLLAQAWGRSLGAPAVFAQNVTKPAAYFLERFEAELKAEPALQSLFDSRALESLPKLEAEIQKLSAELQRGLDTALKAANGYQIQVEGSVGGSIIIGNNNVINSYYYTGDFVSLNEYYIPPDGVFQRVRVDEFVGRDWLTAKVDAFLNDPNQKSGAFLLVGDAGVGKTAFMAHLVKERRYLHLFAEQVPGQAMLQRALQSLGSQLVTRYQIDPYKDRDTLNVLAGFPDFLERLLRLAASTLTEGEKIVIVCDALDEAGVFPDHFVFGLPKELPDGVYLILSQRPVNTKLPNFEPLRFDLEAQGEDNLEDMEDYLSAVAKRSTVAGQIHAKDYSKDSFVQTLKEKSLGVWMYLHYIVKEIEDGARAPLDLANLPKGLVGYYADYWDDWRYGRKERGKGEEAWNELYAPLLTTLAAAQDAITAEQLTAWAGVKADPDYVDALLHDKWRSFILEKEVEGNTVYAPYHLSFRDFITGKVDTSELLLEQANLVRDLSKKIVKAHKRIVNAFETECNGQWEKLVEQDYPRLHLTAHLNGAKEYKKLTNLLTEGDEKIKWAEAREKKEETYAGYLNDLTSVWDYAEREQNYALAIRCMLIENSIRSLASNVTPELLAELARSSLWSYARCLSMIQQNSNSDYQAKSLELIVPNLSQPLFQEAFSIVCEIKDNYTREGGGIFHDPHGRAEALAAFSSRLNEEQKKIALSVAIGIKFEFDRIRTLSALASYLDHEKKTIALQEAVSATRNISNEFYRAKAISDLAPYLIKETKTQALAIVNEIEFEAFRAKAFSALAPYLNKETKTQALAVAIEIKDEFIRIDTLCALIPYINDELKTQVLSAMRKIKNKSARASALSFLVPYLNKETKTQVLQETLSAARQFKDMATRAQILSFLVPYLNKETKAQVLQETLSAARQIKDIAARAQILSFLIPYLNKETKAQVLQETLSAARQIKSASDRFHVLSTLAPYLTGKLKTQILQDALSTAVQINDYFHADALTTLAPHLNDELKRQAFSIACQVNNESKLIQILSTLTPYLNKRTKAQVLQEALSAARQIKSESSCVRALFALAPHLNKKTKAQVLQESLSILRQIKDKAYCAQVLIALAPHLDKKLKTQVLQETLSLAYLIEDKSDHVDVLTSLAPFLENEIKIKILQDALSVAHQIKDETDCTHALITLAPYLTDELKTQALFATLKIKDESTRAEALMALIPHLNKKAKVQALQEAFSAAHQIKNKSFRVHAFSTLAPYLNKKEKAQAIQEALSAIFQTDISFHIRPLSSLAPYLTDELKMQAFSSARQIKDETIRAKVLTALIPHLNKKAKTQVIQEALSSARQINVKSSRASAITDLAPHLSKEAKTQVLQESLSVVRQIKDKTECTQALIALVPHLGKDAKAQVAQEAFSFARHIKNESSRVKALSALAPHLKTQALQEALSSARQIKDESFRAKALFALAPHLNKKTKTRILQETLSAVCQIKLDTYRAGAISTLAPHLNDELKIQAVSTARQIKDELSRFRALSALVPHLNKEAKTLVLQDTLSVARKIKDESERVRALTALTPYFNKETKITILQNTLYLCTSGFEVNKILDKWREIKFEGLNKHVIPFIRFTSQKNREGGLISLSAIAPAIIHFRGPDITTELFRAITDVTRWWP